MPRLSCRSILQATWPAAPRSRTSHAAAPVGLWLALALLWTAPVTLAESQDFVLDTSQWNDQPRSVHVAGGFNGWSQTADPLQKIGPTRWSTTLDLEPGVHLYKFVIDGQRWITDPQFSDPALEESDGHGGINSAVLVGFDARKLPAPSPDHVNPDGVIHDPARPDHLSLVSDQHVMLGVDAQADDVQRIVVHLLPGQASHELSAGPRAMGAQTFVGLLPIDPQTTGYVLELIDGDDHLFLSTRGTADQLATDAGFTLPQSPDVRTPDWARDAVWYQIFAERFRNANPDNDPGDHDHENLLPWTADWWQTHPDHGETPGDQHFYVNDGNVWKRRFGGDLQGVQQQLPYLRKLGVNAIYFNPIFEADSMHKYDTSDFRHVDDNFGIKSDTPTRQVPGETDDPATWQWSDSDRVFLDFLEEAHRQGFKVIVDGVFNHVGTSHPFFQDLLAKGKKSRYADWFEITDWGDPKHWRQMDEPLSVHGRPGGIQWKAWDKDNGALPVFAKDDQLGLAEGPRQHIFDITTRWLAPDGDPSRGIDGWRLDVPQDIPHPFWKDWRKLVKDTKPEAYITGEIWHYAHPWLQGDEFDAVMNYEFAKAAEEFFVDQQTALTPTAFADRLRQIAYAYPLPIALVQQNLFDSHDTDRVASMFVNPDRNYDGQNRLQDTGPNYNSRPPTDEEWQRLEQAVTFQMTYLGAPMIYYGTEAGMWGPDDPSDRMPMFWPDLMPYQDPQVRFRTPLFEHYQRLIALREALPALRRGLFRSVVADDDAGVVVYERRLEDQRVFVALNRSPRTQTVKFELPEGVKSLVDVLDPANAELVEDLASEPDARPTIRLTADPTLHQAKGGGGGGGGGVECRLMPYTSAVLIEPAALGAAEPQ